MSKQIFEDYSNLSQIPVRVWQETLTDGSLVYDVEVNGAFFTATGFVDACDRAYLIAMTSSGAELHYGNKSIGVWDVAKKVAVYYWRLP